MSDKSGLIFRAIPDSGKVRIVPTPEGGVTPIWPNSAVIPGNLTKELENRATTIWFPRYTESTIPDLNWAVNMCADADEYAEALSELDTAFDGLKNFPIFNHPRSVMMTRRDIIAQRLQGIPNLIVPNCVRFYADDPSIFKKVFRDNGFKYPVLIRPGASQTGQDLVKIDHDKDWGKVHTIPWGGQNLFMTQYVDFSNKDGKFEKVRIAGVNNKILFRSFFIGDEWNVHGGPRTKEKIQRKLKYMAEFSKQTDLLEVSRQLQDIIHLDLWAADIGVLPDGRFLFFEANAAMSIADIHNTPDELVHMVAPILTPILENLSQSLRTPNGWRSCTGLPV
jgi:hypothetical protein